MRKQIPFVLAIGIICIFITGCMEMSSITRKKFSCMGTQVEIIVGKSAANNRNIEDLFNHIKKECSNFEENYSYFENSSIVSKINENLKVRVAEETKKILTKAKEISTLTEGAFDFTVVPLMELWGFYEDKKIKAVPKEEKIKALLEFVDYKKVKIKENNLVTKVSNNIKIDLAGIAKGLLVDKIVNIIKKNGIQNAIVNAGGDMYCLGKSPDGKSWSIGIQHPRKGTVILGKVSLSDMAIATSGDYENYFTIDGKRYSHIMNPFSGYPVSNSTIAVTVIAPDTATADGLSTAVMVLGAKEGLGLLNSLSEVEGVIISKEEKSEINFSEGFKKGNYDFTYENK